MPYRGLVLMATFDFVCVNFRTEHHVAALAQSLDRLAESFPGSRLVVVDCGGAGPTWTPLPDPGALEVEVCDPGANLGFARAANIGFGRTRADAVVFVNPDVQLDVGPMAELLRDGWASNAVAWTGVLRNADGSTQRNTAPVPSLRLQAAEYLLAIDTRLPPVSRARSVGTISGALLCVRAAEFRAVHGFDESYPLYVEDVDLCIRLAERGRLMQLPLPVGMHAGGVSASSAPRETAALLHGARVRFYRQRGSLQGALARATVLTGCALRQVRRRDRTSTDLKMVFRASRSGFALDSLLPPRQEARLDRRATT